MQWPTHVIGKAKATQPNFYTEVVAILSPYLLFPWAFILINVRENNPQQFPVFLLLSLESTLLKKLSIAERNWGALLWSPFYFCVPEYRRIFRMVWGTSVFAMQEDHNTSNYYEGTQYHSEDYETSRHRLREVFIDLFFWGVIIYHSIIWQCLLQLFNMFCGPSNI